MYITDIIENKDIIFSIKNKYKKIKKLIKKKSLSDFTSSSKKEKKLYYLKFYSSSFAIISLILFTLMNSLNLMFLPDFISNTSHLIWFFTPLFFSFFITIYTVERNKTEYNKFLSSKNKITKYLFNSITKAESANALDFMKHKMLEKEIDIFTKEENKFLLTDNNIELINYEEEKISKDLMVYFKNKDNKITFEEKENIFEFIYKFYLVIDSEKLELLYQQNHVKKVLFINKNTKIRNI
jgi:hypothetical protein